MPTERLTTLAAVKDWLGVTDDSGDAALQRVIDAASQFTLNWLHRPTLRRATYTQTVRPFGKGSVILQNWPVLSVSSVVIGSTSIAVSTFNGAIPSSGYVLSEARLGNQFVNVYGYYFNYPSQVVYTAGFERVVPVTVEATLSPTAGDLWVEDISVTIDGADATKVAADPAAGQYAVDEEGEYTFNVADVGSDAVIRYGYVPADIAFAVTELVGEWYRRRDRIGLLSKTLGGQETVTFSNVDVTPVVQSSLQPYRNVVPL